MNRSEWVALLATVVLAAACSGSDPVVLPAESVMGSPPESLASNLDTDDSARTAVSPSRVVVTGAENLADSDFLFLRGRRVGLIAHAASTIGDKHLADLIDESPDVELVALFGPEHGLRGTAGAGDSVPDAVDQTTGVPIFSLYGETRAPTEAMLEGIDVLVYDLQDVGARYFTYISTMGLAMQAAATADIPFVVLDRPNPLGGTPAGFVRDVDVDSFVAMYPIADNYGLTAGELARAIVGEAWLPGLDQLDLRVIEMDGWTRTMRWADTGREWITPSPALQTSDGALLYPALVLFEATTASVGRGTSLPFGVLGAPRVDGDALTDDLNALNEPGVEFEPISFIPNGDNVANAGTPINGVRIIITDHDAIEPADLGVHLLYTVLRQRRTQNLIDQPDGLDLLAGGPTLRTQLAAGMTADEIIAARQDELAEFEALTEQYRIYPSE